jgi:hypothetical protein
MSRPCANYPKGCRNRIDASRSRAIRCESCIAAQKRLMACLRKRKQRAQQRAGQQEQQGTANAAKSAPNLSLMPEINDLMTPAPALGFKAK